MRLDRTLGPQAVDLFVSRVYQGRSPLLQRLPELDAGFHLCPDKRGFALRSQFFGGNDTGNGGNQFGDVVALLEKHRALEAFGVLLGGRAVERHGDGFPTLRRAVRAVRVRPLNIETSRESDHRADCRRRRQ
jgi:hypothetical protein